MRFVCCQTPSNVEVAKTSTRTRHCFRSRLSAHITVLPMVQLPRAKQSLQSDVPYRKPEPLRAQFGSLHTLKLPANWLTSQISPGNAKDGSIHPIWHQLPWLVLRIFQGTTHARIQILCPVGLSPLPTSTTTTIDSESAEDAADPTSRKAKGNIHSVLCG
jgi:hypothetical protein